MTIGGGSPIAIQSMTNTKTEDVKATVEQIHRLESAGCLSSYSVEHNGRLRKFYSITETGRDKIKDYLLDFKELMQIYEYIAGEVKK